MWADRLDIKFTCKIGQLIFAAFLFVCVVTIAKAGESMPDKLALQRTLLAGQFSSIERQLTELQMVFQSGHGSDLPLIYGYYAFATTNPAVIVQLRRWVKTAPGSAKAHAALGINLEHLGWTVRGTSYASKTVEQKLERMQGYMAQARAELRRAIEIDPSLSIAHAELIRIAKSQSGNDRQSILSKALRDCPTSVAIRYAYLFGLQPKWGGSMGRMQKFLAETKLAESGSPELVLLRGFRDYTIGDSYYLDNQYTEALRYYTKAISSGEFALYYMARGRVERNAGQLKAALDDLNHALILTPQDTALLEERANVYFDMKEWEEALKDIELALQLDPRQPSLLRFRGWVREKLEKTDVALLDYKASLEYNAFDPWTYGRMGAIEYRKKNYRAASHWYLKATDLNKERVDYWFYLAGALSYLKQCETRYALVRYKALCAKRKDSECTAARIKWADGLLKYVHSNIGCWLVTDDTRPEF